MIAFAIWKIGPSPLPRSPQHPRVRRPGRLSARAAVLSPQARCEERRPANLDAVPRRRRPRRPAARARARLGLMFATIFAVALLVYWCASPLGRHQSETYFKNGSVDRGAVLVREPRPARRTTRRSRCSARTATAATAAAGRRPRSSTPTDPTGRSRPRPSRGRRRRSTPSCCASRPDEVEQIITYGRPGTPMQPWGVLGGGPKNEQTIADLVAYIESIQLTPDRVARRTRQKDLGRGAGKARRRPGRDGHESTCADAHEGARRRATPTQAMAAAGDPGDDE